MKKIVFTIAMTVFTLVACAQLDTVNIGTSANSGDGESLRSAFLKVNDFMDDYNGSYLYQLAISNHALTLTTTGATNVTLPTSGTLATTTQLDALITNAEIGIRRADSTGYAPGNYLPRYSAEQLITSMGGGATGVSLATELQSLGANVKAIPIFCDMDASALYTLLDSTIYVTAVYIPVAETITGVRFSLGTQGDYTADGNNRVGLYKVSGTTATLVASTVNNGDLWKGTQYAWTNHAFSSIYTAEAGAYYIGFLYNYSAQTTAPAIYCGEAVSLGNQSTFMGNSVRVRGTLANQSDLPASFSITGTSAKADSPMIILY